MTHICLVSVLLFIHVRRFSVFWKSILSNEKNVIQNCPKLLGGKRRVLKKIGIYPHININNIKDLFSSNLWDPPLRPYPLLSNKIKIRSFYLFGQFFEKNLCYGYIWTKYYLVCTNKAKNASKHALILQKTLYTLPDPPLGLSTL